MIFSFLQPLQLQKSAALNLISTLKLNVFFKKKAHVQVWKSNHLSDFPLQCILTSKSLRNIPTRHVSPQPWWSQTPTASAPSAPRRSVFSPHRITPQRPQLDACSHLCLPATVGFRLEKSMSVISMGVFAWESAVNLRCFCSFLQ